MVGYVDITYDVTQWVWEESSDLLNKGVYHPDDDREWRVLK